MSPKRLSARETDFQDLFEQSPSFFAVLSGPEYVFEEANAAYFQLIGHRDILGKPAFEALPELVGQGFKELLDEVVATGKPFIARELPVVLNRSAGSPPEEAFVDFIYQPLRNPGGEVVGILAHGSEVTDQVVARRDAENASRQVVEVLESLTDIVLVLDKQWNVRYVNPAAQLLMERSGRDPNVLIGTNFWETAPHLRNSDFERVSLDAEKNGKVGEVELQGTDGNWYEARIVPAHERVTIFARDVTARHEAEASLRLSEEQFRTALNTMPTLAWIANGDGWIFWYNRRWFEYTGTTPEDMEGWGWQSVHDPEILSTVNERWKASISSGEPFEMEFPLRSADGEMRWFLTRVSPLRDGSGNIQRWFGTNTDVHAQREAAEAARSANQAKSDFLASMSHETRQPINATLGFLDILEMGIYGALAAEQREALSRVRTNQQQLLTVITDILSFARLEAGKVQLEVTEIDCSEILDSIPALVEPQVHARGLVLEIEHCDEDVIAMGDRNRILQICTNLITNATRATDKGGRIIVRAEPDGASLRIEVEDTGKGIPEDKLESIFSPFVQLDRTFSQPREGVGLGLAISRDLAIAMGGQLTARSTPGRGSVFTLSLPRAR